VIAGVLLKQPAAPQRDGGLFVRASSHVNRSGNPAIGLASADYRRSSHAKDVGVPDPVELPVYGVPQGEAGREGEFSGRLNFLPAPDIVLA
jgi:hypothetical protein